MSDLNEQNIKVVPKPKTETGIDTDKTIFDNIINASQIGSVDLSSIDALNTSAQTRERTYELIDSMAQDDIISSVIETYTEDSVQKNDKGKVVWIESSKPEILNYTSWILDSLNIDKQLPQWIHCLITYGDVYIRLYRKSDYGEDLLFKDNARNKKLNESKEKIAQSKSNSKINEDIKLRIYDNTDPYVPYVEMIANPGEMFDLQKFGKTHGFVKAPISIINQSNDEFTNYLSHYNMKQKDIEIFDATTFVHGCITSTTQRQPETVDIFLNKTGRDFDITDKDENIVNTSYSVKRGQSILFNSFRIWRELNLLESSALLNRLTKSAIVRILNVDIAEMPKEQVQVFMQRLKDKIEQKTGIDAGKKMTEYTNSGPIENTIIVPVHEGKGQITATTLGGDFDPKSLVDLEYFRDKLFGSLKVPKQFFGFTSDGAGFNGGTSLTILSSRYGKSITKIQDIAIQLVTDIINLFLIDRGLDNYVNKFTVKMQAPTTQEELDRRTNTDNKIRYVGDVMNQLSDVEDKVVKLKIYKSLLSSCIDDSEVITYLQTYIDELEKKDADDKENTKKTKTEEDNSFEESVDNSNEVVEDHKTDNLLKDVLLEKDKSDDDSYMPTPEELGIDLTK